MLRIGLTGGMGAGKSTVSTMLAERGAVIIDSDRVAREVVAPGTPGLAALVEAFGAEILQPDGGLNRAALAARAFRDDASRTRLNAITHPLVGERTAALFAAAPADAIVVQDIPLLVENGLAPLFNLVLVVGADRETRVRRLIEQRGIDEADARARIAAQATDEQRHAVADVWLDNGGAPEMLEPVVERLWQRRLLPFERNVRTRTVAPAAPDAVPTDPSWPAQGRRLTARLRSVCGGHARSVEHVGATADPGRAAPDLIELCVAAVDPAAVDALAEPLAAAGFPPIGDERYGSADPGRPARVTVRTAAATSS